MGLKFYLVKREFYIVKKIHGLLNAKNKWVKLSHLIRTLILSSLADRCLLNTESKAVLN